MTDTLIADTYQQSRRELKSFLTRLVLRPAIAEELVQSAALRLLELPQDQRPADRSGIRGWLFRVGTNLAIDHLRRHATRHENLLDLTRERAQRDAQFMGQSLALRGSEETRYIARQHLAVCLSCTLRNLAPEQAATLLLIEAYGFSVQEAANIVSATVGQSKHWLQMARATLRERYAQTCALVNQTGVCHQCSELSEFFGHGPSDPLQGTARDIEARLAIVRNERDAQLGPWHRLMMDIVDDLLRS